MAITIGGMGPDGKLKRGPDAYNRAEVGVGPAAQAIAHGVGSSVRTAGRAMNAGEEALRGLNAVAEQRNAERAAQLSGAQRYVQGGLASLAGHAGAGFSAGVAGQPNPMSRPQAGSAAPVPSLSRPFAGVGSAVVDGARGAMATNLMRPGGGPAGVAGGAGASPRAAPVTIDLVRPDGTFASQARQPAGAPAMQQATPTGAVRDQFWQDQAASIPGGTQRASRGNFSAMGPERQGPSPTWQSQAAALSRPSLGQAAPQVNLTRPEPNPAGQARALLDPRSAASEMVRRAENAMSSFRVRSPAANTRSAMQRHYDEAAGMRDFWLNQAASVGGRAHDRFTQAQQLRSQEGHANASNATTLQRGAASDATQLQATGMQQAGETQRGEAQNAARLQAAQMQQQGAMDRTQAQIGAELRRPQQPIQLADGTLARFGDDGQLVPYSLPDGSTARGARAQSEVPRDYMAEAMAPVYGKAYSEALQIMDPQERAAALAQIESNPRFSGLRGGQQQRQQTRTGVIDGRRVAQYSDGSIQYLD